jgi:hypothetical protein
MCECDREPFEIPPVYNLPRVSHGSEPGAGWAFVMSVCIVGLVFGLGTTGVAQWILTTVLVAAAAGLPVSACAWWWAIHK